MSQKYSQKSLATCLKMENEVNRCMFFSFLLFYSIKLKGTEIYSARLKGYKNLKARLKGYKTEFIFYPAYPAG